MFHQILVPLDGSRQAEAALTPAVTLCQRCGNIPLMLVHIIEKNAPASVHGERHLTSEQEAHHYLYEVSRRVPAGIPTQTHIHQEEVRNIPKSIAEHTEELHQDLVVMCTHGSGGPKEWAVGSIAQQVIGMGHTPVLLVRPDSAANTSPLNRLLVAIDHDPEHASGLRLAAEYARQTGAALHLLTVIPRPEHLRGEAAAAGRLSPAATAALLDLQVEDIALTLHGMVEELQRQGIEASEEVRRGDPLREIARCAQEQNAHAVVLGTHGRAGMGAFWAGSVAPRLPSQTHLPLLLVPGK